MKHKIPSVHAGEGGAPPRFSRDGRASIKNFERRDGRDELYMLRGTVGRGRTFIDIGTGRGGRS